MADFVLGFGKYKGQRLGDVCPSYVQWLTARRFNVVDTRIQIKDATLHDSLQYLWKYQRPAIMAAREYIDSNNRCVYCGLPLVAFGHARSNGKDHPDWSTRRFHKKCWKILVDK